MPVKIGPRRPSDPPSLVSVASYARADLSWLQKHHGIEFIF